MPVICKYCRTPNQEGSALCSLCGSRLPYTPAPTPVTPPPAQTPPPASTTPTVPTPTPTPTPPNQTSNTANLRFTLFQTEAWDEKWPAAVASAENQDKKAGIILTNTRGCNGSLRNELWMNLTEYMNFKSTDGVEYYVLDLANQAVKKTYTGEIESLIDLITDIYNVEKPEYIMILGDFKTVPNIVWENRSNDSDKVVFSDLPFITLSTDSPFNDIHYEVKSLIKVGRIPTSAASGFKEAFIYLKNTKNSTLTVDDLKAFFLSAEGWEISSREIGQPVSADMHFSPSNGSFEFKGSLDNYNVLMFNLHGSNGTHLWYGEDKSKNVAPAFNASKLPKNRNFILFTEACYGARPFNGGINTESMVSTALRNGCCAFVGSTQIAWGGRGGMSCADILSQQFTKNIVAGYSAGESFNAALPHVERNRWNDCSLKTIIEFALYGDPSYTPIGSSNKGVTQVKKKAFSKNNLAYRVVDGEEQKAVSVKAAYVEENVECVLKAFVEESHPDLMDVKPRFFMDDCTGDYQAIYNKTAKNEEVCKLVKVFFDSNGSVKDQYVSKYVNV